MEVIITLVLIPLITWLTERVKKYIDLTPKQVVAILSLFFGLCWALFEQYVNAEVKAELIGFVGLLTTSSVGFYEYIKKYIK